MCCALVAVGRYRRRGAEQETGLLNISPWPRPQATNGLEAASLIVAGIPRTAELTVTSRRRATRIRVGRHGRDKRELGKTGCSKDSTSFI